KEKDDLKAKVEKWHNSSKNLGKLLNSQMSAYDKFGLGYGDHRYNGILSYENEVLQSVFKGKESDFDNPPLNNRINKIGEMHAVPPPMTGNYMPTGPEIEIDYSQFTYGPKQTQPSESESQSSECDTCESNCTSHWRSKRKNFYGYASNRVPKHDVYSIKRILALTNIKFNVWYSYGHLEEIEVGRSDQQLYKFMEGDIPRLHLNNIEDMLILVVQNRLVNIKSEDIVHLDAALRMFTRRIVIQK
ncbi:hypothetical protein Tco_0750520, partial [Tanacetum coccineum]